MARRTKIVATLGPATQSQEAIEGIIKAGVDVVRLNFSHGAAEEHIERAALVRSLSAKHGRFVAILADLQGPKIRIARFAEGKVSLRKGQSFTLDATLDRDAGDETQVGIDYKALITDSRVSDILLLDDGRIELEVVEAGATSLVCKVLVGGPLSNNKGINRKGGGLSAAALTEKDRQDIKTAAMMQADYLAVSFPRDAADMVLARTLLHQAGGDANLIAKIERAETVEDTAILDAIIQASDGVMVARGDLGVEIGDAELVAVQKLIIERARTLNRVVITATQMMETMITQSLPTRAEVFDVANAVLDGTDAVMLSAETATGAYLLGDLCDRSRGLRATHSTCTFDGTAGRAGKCARPLHVSCRVGCLPRPCLGGCRRWRWEDGASDLDLCSDVSRWRAFMPIPLKF
ncbi:hypothetical protein PSE10B_46860 [Pseudomonas amygdali pv. eriobotryae]|uniref:pyruvate kinase n=1 Tax=Pseudomonas amygdali TaxID=47877 RepID=UPI0019886715|nr:pyruvate kinase [Pseudomonas amygdali]GFZ68164.1 hypothetical protein PSE10B_46860 [Pseudomonas amygdali pv. eriobotryae]